MDIKPIETVYNGYRFRSRLEARWAVFFDAAGIEYQYEPEGFDLGDGLYYLPDFYLPKEKSWVEIKGKDLTDDERLKIYRFCEKKSDGTWFRLLCGAIPNQLIDMLGKVGIPGYAYIDPDGFMGFAEHAWKTDFIKPISGLIMFFPWIPMCRKEIIRNCLDVARQARFEHGETPRVRR